MYFVGARDSDILADENEEDEVCVRTQGSKPQIQPRGWAITSEACIDSTEEEDSFTRPRRDTRGTTSTKVESSHDLMWSSCDLVALIH